VPALCLALACVANAGEAWFPAILEEGSAEYLPDYSYAGYRWGETPLPRPPVTFSVGDFGALPDDGDDDTAAFRSAIEAANREQGMVVIAIPEGRFHLSGVLLLERSQLVLRGAGRGAGGTVLAFTQPLEQMRVPDETGKLRRELRQAGKREGDRNFSPFAWTGGVIWVRNPSFEVGGDPRKVIAGRRGSTTLELAQEAPVQPGDVFWLRWFNPDGEGGSLLRHLFGASRVVVGREVTQRRDAPLVRQPVTLAAVEGRMLQLVEPLLHDVRPEWTPDLAPIRPLEEIGLEEFRIEFPETLYAGHHLESGWNGIYLSGLQHSWVRNVTVVNSDSAIICNRAKNVTLEKIAVLGRGGHYSVTVSGGYGVLVREFRFEAPSLHSPSFNALAQLSVFTDGEVRHASLDQHRGYPMQNLFDRLRLQRGDAELFRHGGADAWAPTAGAFTTFWNLRADVEPGFWDLRARWEQLTQGTLRLGPEIRDAPRARIVGLHGNHAFSLGYGPDAYVEGLGRRDIAVPSLYEYQLSRRLTGRSP
jgi:hypothetical protein